MTRAVAIAGWFQKAAPHLLIFSLTSGSVLFGQIPPPDDHALVTSSAGEKLIFQVEWNPPWFLFFLPNMIAGETQMQVTQGMDYEGRKAVRITFKAESSGTFANLAGVKIDDEFVYISDAGTLCTITASEKIREGKRKRNIDVVYFQDRGRLHIHDLDVAVIPNKVRKDEYQENIPSCVKDVFSALLSIRQLRFRLGLTQRTLIANTDKVKEVETIVEKKEMVSTPMGRFESWRLNTVALLGTLFREGGQFRIWLTADDRKIPVQFEARVRLGRVTGKLKAAELPPPDGASKTAAAQTVLCEPGNGRSRP